MEDRRDSRSCDTGGNSNSDEVLSAGRLPSINTSDISIAQGAVREALGALAVLDELHVGVAAKREALQALAALNRLAKRLNHPATYERGATRVTPGAFIRSLDPAGVFVIAFYAGQRRGVIPELIRKGYENGGYRRSLVCDLQKEFLSRLERKQLGSRFGKDFIMAGLSLQRKTGETVHSAEGDPTKLRQRRNMLNQLLSLTRNALTTNDQIEWGNIANPTDVVVLFIKTPLQQTAILDKVSESLSNGRFQEVFSFEAIDSPFLSPNEGKLHMFVAAS